MVFRSQRECPLIGGFILYYGVIELNRPLILVGSVTYAMKGRDLLMRRGFRVYMERVPKSRETGCGYALYVPVRTDEAERFLREAGVRVMGRSERGVR